MPVETIAAPNDARHQRLVITSPDMVKLFKASPLSVGYKLKAFLASGSTDTTLLDVVVKPYNNACHMLVRLLKATQGFCTYQTVDDLDELNAIKDIGLHITPVKCLPPSLLSLSIMTDADLNHFNKVLIPEL